MKLTWAMVNRGVTRALKKPVRGAVLRTTGQINGQNIDRRQLHSQAFNFQISSLNGQEKVLDGWTSGKVFRFLNSLFQQFISESKQNLSREPIYSVGRPEPKPKPRTTICIDTQSPTNLSCSLAFLPTKRREKVRQEPGGLLDAVVIALA